MSAWLLIAATGCGAREPGATPHVLVILVDTLRADHTSLAGYARDTTPRLGGLAAEGTSFARHLANAPWTKPSVASILTGLLPPAHGSQWGDFQRRAAGEVDVLADGFDTLPEILRRHGYATVALMTNTTITPEIGYAQGFDRFEQLGAGLAGDRAAIRGALDALDGADRPTFVWCHLMAPHNYLLPPGQDRAFHSRTRTPIRPGEAYAPRMLRRHGFRFREQAIDTYDEVVRWVDEQVSGLVRAVREAHPGTLVVFTSDHGEEFGEHGGYFHARTLHSELLHVPLVLWGPGVARGEVVTRLTQSVDLLPTILAALGLDPVESQGRSLLASDPDPAPAVYAEKRNGANAMRALILADGKLLESKPPGPPGEKPPISGDGTWRFFTDPVGPDTEDAIDALSPEELSRRRARLEETWARSLRIHASRAGDGATRRPLRDDELEALRALGYVEGEAGEGGAP